MTKVYLPKYLEAAANQFATDYVEEVEGVPRGNPKFAKKHAEALNEFCKDYYESLTGIKANPYSPKTEASFLAFKAALFEGPESFLGRHVKGADKRLMYERRIKSMVMHLAHLYLNLEGGVEVKTREHARSAYQYAERSGDRLLDAAKRREVDKERLERQYVVCVWLAAISHVMNATRWQEIKKIVEDYTAGKTTGEMHPAGTKVEFAESLKRAFEGELEGVSFNEAAARELSKPPLG